MTPAFGNVTCLVKLSKLLTWIAAVFEPLSEENLQRISAAFLASLEAFRAKVPDDYYNQEEAGLRSALLATSRTYAHLWVGLLAIFPSMNHVSL